MLAPGIIIVFLTIQVTNSYILLTANLDDVQSLAKRIISSPVVEQIGKIWRRASNRFNKQMAQPKGWQGVNRADSSESTDDDVNVRSRYDEQNSQSTNYNDNKDQNVSRRHKDVKELLDLGKNASVYLKSIKKIFENI